MERINDTGMTGRSMICPLCRNPDTHYLEETGTWVCNHCQYTWYTIEQCSLHRHTGDQSHFSG